MAFRTLAGSVLALFVLGCGASGQEPQSQTVVSRAEITPSSTAPVSTDNPDIVVDPASLLPDLPTLPPKKASLIGGTIQKVDRVRDQFTVQVFGGGKMKILFDPRTHILQGDVKAFGSDLHVGDRVYVDTILDGSTVFARNIRLASAGSGGNSQGVVKSYRADKGELVLRDLLSPDPVKLHVTSGTQVVQGDHAASAVQLVPGTLVNVTFVAREGWPRRPADFHSCGPRERLHLCGSGHIARPAHWLAGPFVSDRS